MNKRTAGHPGGASPASLMAASEIDIALAKQREADQAFPGDPASTILGTVSSQHDTENTMQDTSNKASNEAKEESSNMTSNMASNMGDNVSGTPPTDTAPGPAARETSSEIRARVWTRLNSEGRDMPAIALQRDEMAILAKKSIKDREERLIWVYSELDRMYPPLGEEVETGRLPVAESAPKTGKLPVGDDGQIQGLGQIPEGWPELPANASIASEVAWVQANRLRIVEERPGRATLVRLEQAMSPAPSWAALGWLETSIRSYAKFVDVAAKVSGSTDDESAVMRRERLAIEEVAELLAEMRSEG